MKTVYLVLFLWHHTYHGSPTLTLTPMLSLAACEAAGAFVAELVKDAPPNNNLLRWRCIEVASK